jgi:putative transposase
MKKNPPEYRTYRRSRSVRLPRDVYSLEGALYFVTACCADRKPQLTEQAAQTVITTWREVFENLGYRVWCLVVMPDHLHGLLECITGKEMLGTAIGKAKTLSSHRLRGIRELRWQARFHDHVVRDHEEPRLLAEYIVNNPVRAGLVEDWQEWPWTYTGEGPL